MKEASCRLLGVVFEILDELGVPRERLVEGTDLELAPLLDERGWMRWTELRALMANASRLVGGDTVLRELAVARIADAESNRSLKALARTLAGPKGVYWALTHWVYPQLFSVVRMSYADVSEREVRIGLEHDPQLPVMPELVVMIEATLVALPTFIGLPRATVTVEAGGPSTTFHVVHPASRSLWMGLKRRLHATWAPDALTRELEHQAEALRARNRELDQARREAESLAEARERLLTTVSHELRTPLNAVLGTAQLLERTRLDPEQARLVEASRGSAEHLASLIDVILLFNRVSAGDGEPHRERFELRALLERRLDAMRPRLAPGVDARLSAPPGPIGVLGDPTWVERAIDSLLDNAARFTEVGEVELLARAEAEDRWAIAVRDTGPGMTEEVRARAFAPLQQGDDRLSRRHGGLGLGLALVQQVAGAMGGRVELASEVGVGTVITLHLPLPAVPDLALPAPGTATSSSGMAAPSAPEEAARPDLEDPSTERTALIVEDQRINQVMLERLLQHLGYTSTTAENGEVGVERYREGSFDVVLMDCQMPVMDGHAATRRIRALEADQGRRPVPIVAVTANATDADRRAALDAGMDAYLTKPVRLEVLDQTLRGLGRREPKGP